MSQAARACDRGCASQRARRVGALLLAVLLGLGLAGVGWGQTAGPILAGQGARCRFVSECSQLDSIGLHLGTSLAVRTDARRSHVDAQGGLRL